MLILTVLLIIKHIFLSFAEMTSDGKVFKRIELLTLNSVNRTHKPNVLKDYFVYVESPEKFARFKSSIHEFYIWHAPTSSIGGVLPTPKFISQSSEVFKLSEFVTFKIQRFTNKQCELVWLALKRYKQNIFVEKKVTHISIKNLSSFGNSCKDKGDKCIIKYISVNVHSCSNSEWPSDSMNESYTLVTGNGHIEISSQETWGLLRALETLSQLIINVVDVNNEWMAIKKTNINDEPKFRHRGLMIDTSRHFMSLKVIMNNLDAMVMNKLNVFHWHMCDDQSFPFGSQSHPELPVHGAFDSNMVYNHSIIRLIVEYARQRGIRVIPEIDVPGHTGSWIGSHSELMVECWNENSKQENFGPLNPTLKETYSLLNDLYSELISLFPDKYLHIGLDEVGMGCWYSDPSIRKFMKVNDMNHIADLLGFFVQSLQKMINLNYPNKKLIVWQEAFQKTINLTQNSVIQVWKNQIDEVQLYFNSAFPIIFSTSFYLDHLSYGPQWVQYYLSGFDRVSEKNILGGEACMWNEFQTKETVLQIIWPASIAIAELLWFGMRKPILNFASEVEEHRCRMLRSGIPVGVAGGPTECKFMRDIPFYSLNVSIVNKVDIAGKSFSKMDSALKFVILFLSGFMMNHFVQICRNKRKLYSTALSLLLIVLIVIFFMTLDNTVII